MVENYKKFPMLESEWKALINWTFLLVFDIEKSPDNFIGKIGWIYKWDYGLWIIVYASGERNDDANVLYWAFFNRF